MNRAIVELEKQIESCTKKLAALREEFDRLDVNHPHQCMQIVRDIHECAAGLETLIRFHKKMKGVLDE